ncbi:MAG TPA: arsenical resistance protein ArsH, partial [Oceanicaulis sp.]|nr:arsenical resistance protein ArsH [Oceanicaulis sp.]
MPNLVVEHVAPINQDALAPLRRMTHKPRILLLYGSLREHSFS